jgi:hypothetical protein
MVVGVSIPTTCSPVVGSLRRRRIISEMTAFWNSKLFQLDAEVVAGQNEREVVGSVLAASGVLNAQVAAEVDDARLLPVKVDLEMAVIRFRYTHDDL